MSPHPVKDVDMERKEELILAKQLRAARVTILPKVSVELTHRAIQSIRTMNLCRRMQTLLITTNQIWSVGKENIMLNITTFAPFFHLCELTKI